MRSGMYHFRWSRESSSPLYAALDCGSGKSTLLNLIGGLDVPTRGQIIIRGHDIASLKRKELTIFRRRNIGFVFQNYSLMPVLNVYDNVALPVTFDRGKHVDHDYIRELLKELGLWEKRKRYPSELSGGQQQRVALARALANKPAPDPGGRAHRKPGLWDHSGGYGTAKRKQQKI